MALFGLTVMDRNRQTRAYLPVDDILDVVVHALVVAPSVWLDVKCNLGKDAERHVTCWFQFSLLTYQ